MSQHEFRATDRWVKVSEPRRSRYAFDRYFGIAARGRVHD